MSNDVYIIGIDMIKFGRFPNKTVPELAAESILLALDDANLSMADMQAFFCGNIKEVNRMVGQKTLQLVGQTGIPIVNCTNACATGATAFREGWMSIKAGLYDTVLVSGVEKMGTGLLGGESLDAGIPIEGLLGSLTMPAVFAEAGMEHARLYGTTFEQFAKISVKNHHHSTMNPKSRYQIETPLEEVMESELIAYPNTKLMCSANVDGSAAAILVSEKKASENAIEDMIFAYKVAKHVKSNAIVLASDKSTVGIGSGQPSRLDSCKIAIDKMKKFINTKKEIVAASDAFFPFVDGIEKLIQSGVSAVIQPAGSIRDKEIINFANATGTILIFSKSRHFRH